MARWTVIAVQNVSDALFYQLSGSIDIRAAEMSKRRTRHLLTINDKEIMQIYSIASVLNCIILAIILY